MTVLEGVPHLSIKSIQDDNSQARLITVVPVNSSGIMAHRLIWIYAVLLLVSVNVSSQSKDVFSCLNLKRIVLAQYFHIAYENVLFDIENHL